MSVVITYGSTRDAAETGKTEWFVARTRYFRQEIRMRDELTRRGIDSFVPTVRLGKTRGKGTYEKVLAPNILFVKANKIDACMLVSRDRLPFQFVTDCATRQMMVVPDKQMDDFRRVFDLSLEEGGLVDQPLEVGEKVRVTKGALKGVEGYVLELQGRTYVVVSLIGCLWARASVQRAWLEKI